MYEDVDCLPFDRAADGLQPRVAARARNPQPRHRRPRASISVFAAAALVACTSLRTVPLEPGRAPQGIEAGDEVVVTTVRGEKLEFEIVRVDIDALVGEHDRVAFADIATLEVEEIEREKTGGVLFAGGVAALILGLLAVGALLVAAGLPPV
jgi:hypothetical protein